MFSCWHNVRPTPVLLSNQVFTTTSRLAYIVTTTTDKRYHVWKVASSPKALDAAAVNEKALPPEKAKVCVVIDLVSEMGPGDIAIDSVQRALRPMYCLMRPPGTMVP